MSDPAQLSKIIGQVIDEQQKEHPENALLWQMVKTFSLLIDRLESVGDRFLDLYKLAEQERQDARAALWQKYLTKKVKE